MRLLIARPIGRGQAEAVSPRDLDRVSSSPQQSPSSASRSTCSPRRRSSRSARSSTSRTSCRSRAPRPSAAATSTSSSPSSCSRSPGRSRSSSIGRSAEQRSVAEILALTGALAAAAATLVIPGLSGHAGQTAPRGPLARARLAPPRRRLDLDRRARRPPRPLGQPRLGAPHRRPRNGRPAVLAHRVRLGHGPDRLRRLGVGPAPADARVALADLVRRRDPGQGRAARRRDAARGGEPEPDQAAPRRRRRAAGGRRRVRRASFVSSSAARCSSWSPRSSPPASSRAWRHPRRRSRPWARRAPTSARAPSPRSSSRTATPSASRVDPNRAAAPNTVSVRITKAGEARPGRRRHGHLHHARHGNGQRRLPPSRDRARPLRTLRAGARDGRPLGTLVRHPASRRRPFTVLLIDKANG